jgi:RNA polymerase sigma-70 factor (ECF subfamily)
MGMLPHRAEEDSALLAAWRSGDRRAGAALFHRHYESLSRFFVNKAPEAYQEDLIQQAFMAVVESIAGFEQRSSFRTYLLAIAHHVLCKHVHQQVKARRRDAPDHQFLDTCAAQLGRSPSSEAAHHEEQRILLEALRRIPLTNQVVLELHYWEHLTVREIAEVLEVPLGTAKTWLRAGQQRLRAQVEKVAGTLEWKKSTLDNLEHWVRRTREAVSRAHSS